MLVHEAQPTDPAPRGQRNLLRGVHLPHRVRLSGPRRRWRRSPAARRGSQVLLLEPALQRAGRGEPARRPRSAQRLPNQLGAPGGMLPPQGAGPHAQRAERANRTASGTIGGRQRQPPLFAKALDQVPHRARAPSPRLERSPRPIVHVSSDARCRGAPVEPQREAWGSPWEYEYRELPLQPNTAAKPHVAFNGKTRVAFSGKTYCRVTLRE